MLQVKVIPTFHKDKKNQQKYEKGKKNEIIGRYKEKEL